MSKTSGKLTEPGAIFLHMHAGEARLGERKYQLSINVGDGSPMVHSHTSQRWFLLSWEAIMKLAIEAGVDKVEG